MKILAPEKRLIWVDCETFGLDPDTDPILEVGFAITNLNHDILESFEVLVWDNKTYSTHLARVRDSDDPNDRFVFNMHQASGLWNDVRRKGVPPADAERLLNEWLQSHGVYGQVDPLCGSTVDFDRAMLDAQMSTVSRRFHYRNINVSTTKEQCKRFNPRMFAHMEDDAYGKGAIKAHRVLEDIKDTISESRWYVDNFFFTDPDVLDGVE